jgi:hypothetical protein
MGNWRIFYIGRRLDPHFAGDRYYSTSVGRYQALIGYIRLPRKYKIGAPAF